MKHINPDRRDYFFIAEMTDHKGNKSYHCQTTIDMTFLGRQPWRIGEKIFGKISFEGRFEDMVYFINNAVPIKN